MLQKNRREWYDAYMNTSILLTINGWAGKNHLLDLFMIFCASYLVFGVFVAAAICVGYLLYLREWREPIYFVAALILSYAILLLLGHIVTESRPFVDHHLTQLVAHASGKSFPSDHTTVTAAIGFGLWFLTRFKKIGIAIACVAVLIGFARVFVGVHYPIDIVGGLLVGFTGAALTFIAKMLLSKSGKSHEYHSKN